LPFFPRDRVIGVRRPNPGQFAAIDLFKVPSDDRSVAFGFHFPARSKSHRSSVPAIGKQVDGGVGKLLRRIGKLANVAAGARQTLGSEPR
jgi:hypothetical protein